MNGIVLAGQIGGAYTALLVQARIQKITNKLRGHGISMSSLLLLYFFDNIFIKEMEE